MSAIFMDQHNPAISSPTFQARVVATATAFVGQSDLPEVLSAGFFDVAPPAEVMILDST